MLKQDSVVTFIRDWRNWVSKISGQIRTCERTKFATCHNLFCSLQPFPAYINKINTCKRFKSTANNVATYQQQISFVKIWFLNILNKWVENFFDMHIRHKIPHSGTYQLNRSLSILRLFLNSHFCPYLVLKQGCPIHETYGKAVY